MPSVPVLPTSGNVSLDTSQGYRRVQADASAFGGREAQALGAVGQGLDAVAHAADEIDQEQARTEALQADNAYAAALRERLRGPEGYLNQRGENAVNQRAEAEAGIDELAVSTLGNVRNPRARALAEQALRSRAESALGQISEHAANQTREFQVEQIGAAADVASRNAIDAILANDEGHAAESLASANAAVTRLGELNGWGEVLTTERRQALADSITHNVVVELASTDPERAMAYFTAHPVADPTQRRQTLVAMQAAQRQAQERVSGEVWQAIASGRNPRSLPIWREFSTNPLYGPQHIQVNDYLRARAEHDASGATIPANGPAYIAALLAADRNPVEWSAPGVLEQYLSDHAGQIRPDDMEQLLNRRRQIRNGGSDTDAGKQRGAFNATLGLAAAMLRPHGFDPDPPASNRDGNQQQRARAFQGALQREVQSYVSSNGGAPAGDDIQLVIARALAGMNEDQFTNLPEFRVRGRPGREQRSAVQNPGAAVLPFDEIPPSTRAELIDGLRSRLRRMPTRAEVENTFANMSQGLAWDGSAPRSGQ